MPLKRTLILGASLALACGGASPAAKTPKTTQATIDLGPAPEGSDARLAWAIAGAQRSDKNRARDVYRHPKETLEFFGVSKDSHVVELWPGAGWYTEILAPFLRDSGKLTATNFDPAAVSGEQKEHAQAFDAKLAAMPGIYGKVEVVRVKPPTELVLGPDGSADVVLTFRNFHNWLRGGFAKNVVEAAYKVLKPGGVFGVVEHRADPGTDAKTTAETGYVPEATIVDLAKAAGFKLAATSDVNKNPKDDHHHEGGVWALPPSLRNGDKDRAKYVAIGESDRMTLKFVK